MLTQVYLLYLSNQKNRLNNSSISGFSLPEVLAVVLSLGVLAGLVLPNWLVFVDTQSLNKAQSEVYNAIRQAQSQASKDKLSWQASFRENNGIVQWAIHPADVSPTAASWNNLDSRVLLDSETTLQQSSGVRRIQFDHQGNVRQPPLGKITLSHKSRTRVKRCVYVSTILGAMRMAKERGTANSSGDYCY